jgi:hypothetical protein
VASQKITPRGTSKFIARNPRYFRQVPDLRPWRIKLGLICLYRALNFQRIGTVRAFPHTPQCNLPSNAFMKETTLSSP